MLKLLADLWGNTFGVYTLLSAHFVIHAACIANIYQDVTSIWLSKCLSPVLLPVIIEVFFICFLLSNL